MLEKLPAGLGRALRGVRPGLTKLAFNDDRLADVVGTIDVTSPAFAEDGPLPSRYTADGAGLSPPLEWSHVPIEAASLALLIEDADSPTPNPLVHAIVWNLPSGDGRLAEAALGGGFSVAMGRNSYLGTTYLAPDPPPGHGEHRYAFQLFALDNRLAFTAPPGRTKLLEGLHGHAIAKGVLIGTYGRD